jgi:MFS family permease
VVAVAYALMSATGAPHLSMIYLLAAAWGVLNALDTPARQALVPMLVPRELAANAAALSGTVLLIGMTAGSALGAALVAVAGPTAAFAVNAVSFFADVLLLWTIRVAASPLVARAPGQIRAGLRYAWHTPALRGALLAIATIATFSFTLQVSIPIFVRVSLEGGPSLIGLAFTAGMAGSLVGALVAAVLGAPGPHRLSWAAAGMAASLAITATAPVVSVAFIGFVGVGFAWSILIAAVIATLQTADPSMTGRTMATLGVVLLGGMAAGAPITSAVISVAGPRLALVIGAIAAPATAVAVRVVVPPTVSARRPRRPPRTRPPSRRNPAARSRR